MTATELATALISQFEGCRLTAYQDSAGLWTIGYGNRWLADGTPVTADCSLTQADAEALLADGVAGLMLKVMSLVRVAATTEQLAALMSFAWNVGLVALRNSTLLRLFNAGNVDGAAAQFGAWVHSDGQVVEGLVNRRSAERAVFLGDASHFQQET